MSTAELDNEPFVVDKNLGEKLRLQRLRPGAAEDRV